MLLWGLCGAGCSLVSISWLLLAEENLLAFSPAEARYVADWIQGGCWRNGHGCSANIVSAFTLRLQLKCCRFWVFLYIYILLVSNLMKPQWLIIKWTIIELQTLIEIARLNTAHFFLVERSISRLDLMQTTQEKDSPQYIPEWHRWWGDSRWEGIAGMRRWLSSW